jgi:hypothetical protein
MKLYQRIAAIICCLVLFVYGVSELYHTFADDEPQQCASCE